jgi:NADH-quinone oxidoreductase subunit K
MNLDMDAHVVAFFVMALAAAESSVGLAIVIAVFRLKRTANVDDMAIMKG